MSAPLGLEKIRKGRDSLIYFRLFILWIAFDEENNETTFPSPKWLRTELAELHSSEWKIDDNWSLKKTLSNPRKVWPGRRDKISSANTAWNPWGDSTVNTPLEEAVNGQVLQ